MSLPEAAGTWAETMGIYRFLGNDEVEMAEVLRGHRAASLRRAQGVERLLCVQDTTFLNYSGQEEKLRGVGRFAHDEHGLIVHVTLGVSTEGVPLGCLEVESMINEKGRSTRGQCKQRAIGDKQSGRWLRGLQQLNRIAAEQPEGPELIAVADREADIYELFSEPRAEKVHWLVRAAHDRRTSGGRLLWDEVTAKPLLGALVVAVPAGPGRAARRARLEVRSAQVALHPPYRREPLPTVTVWAVHARERGAPAGVEPIEWLLLSDLPASDLATAIERIEWYTCRWVIERFFHTLKSGCQVESLQLSERSRLEAALAIYLIVAWRILWLTLGARTLPQQPASAWLQPDEWRAAWLLHHQTRPPAQPPPIADIVRCIACLGGYLNRKNDRPPGPKVLWRGLQHVHAAAAYQAILSKLPPTCV